MKPFHLKQINQLWQSFLKEWPLPQADRWLAFTFKNNKAFGKNDRKVYSQAFFAAIRHALFAVYCQDIFDKSIDLKISSETWLVRYQDPSVLWQRIKAIKSEYYFNWILLRTGFEATEHLEINALFQSIKSHLSQDNELAKAFIWHSIPYSLKEAFQKRLHTSWQMTDLQQFLKRQDSKSPLWLRVRNLSEKAQILTELKENSLTLFAEKPLQQTCAIAVAGEKGIYDLPSYKNGQFEIQDLASQMIGDVVKPVNTKCYVLDACAGGGGKTMQIAANLNNKGAIYACDIRDHKLEEIKKRGKRGGFFNIRTFAWDWTAPTLPSFGKEIANNQGFDWILVDAPCTSAGTWRRNPDAKWRLNLSELAKLNELQLKILSQAAKLLRPSGQLAYATCSFLVEENEGIIESFLAQNTNFQLQTMQLLGCPQEDSDTMFVAHLCRVQ